MKSVMKIYLITGWTEGMTNRRNDERRESGKEGMTEGQGNPVCPTFSKQGYIFFPTKIVFTVMIITKNFRTSATGSHL